jgi:dCTP diphosphatase
MPLAELEPLLDELRAFVTERDWGRFHDPKNLTMLAVSEAGELAALFRWVDNRAADDFCNDPKNRARVVAEIADVTIAMLLLSDRIGLDLAQAVRDKLEMNRRNYPADAARGIPDRVRSED